MTRSRLKNRFNETKSENNQRKYNKQRDFCLSLYRNTKTQLTFIYSKLTIETLEQGLKYVRVNNKDTRTTPFASFSGVFIVNFEHVSHLALVSLLLTLKM